MMANFKQKDNQLYRQKLNRERIRKYLVISGISLIFFIFGVWELTNPQYWSAFVPSFLANIINNLVLVRIHGIILIFLALWLSVGFYRKIAAILSSLVLLNIILFLLFSSGFSDIVVRDLAIFLFSVSLIFEEEKRL